MNYAKYIVIVFLFLFTNATIGQIDTANLKDEPVVSILTIGTGDNVETLFGHTAIRVKQGDFIDYAYNYGLFDFKTPGFLTKFLRGKLPYAVGRAPMDAFLRDYVATQRPVYEQVLNISSSEKQNIIAYLENNILPEHRLYMYDFIYDNCATRVREAVVKNISGGLSYDDTQFEEKTFRNQLHEYVSDKPWTKWGIDLIVASRTDKQATREEQMFLPDYLQKHLGEAKRLDTLNAGFLLKPSTEVLTFNVAESKTNWFTPFNTFLALAVLILLFILIKQAAIANILANIFFVVMGIASIIVLFMWFGTDHQSTKDNYNVLWISPIYMALPFLRGKIGAICAGILILLSIVCAISVLPQAMPILPILPLILVSLGIYIKQVLSAKEAEAV